MPNPRPDQNAKSVPFLDHHLTRRSFLRGAVFAGLGAALGSPLLGLATSCSGDHRKASDIKMGIASGNQVLWRYLAYKKDTLLKPLGYNVTFFNYQDGDQLFTDFLGGQIDICAVLVNTLFDLPAGAEAQMCLPIAWMKAGFPIVAPASSSLRSVADLQGRKLVILGANHPSTVYWEALVRENYGFSLTAKADMVDLTKLPAATPVDPLLDGRADAAVVESRALTELVPKGSYRQLGDLRAEWIKVSRSDRLLVYGGYVAKPQWLKANGRFVEDLIRLNYEALKAYKSNRAVLIGAATAYAGENAPPMNDEASAYVADYLGYDDVEAERAYLSGADVEDARKMVALLGKAGLLKGAPPDVTRLLYLSEKRPK